MVVVGQSLHGTGATAQYRQNDRASFVSHEKEDHMHGHCCRYLPYIPYLPSRCTAWVLLLCRDPRIADRQDWLTDSLWHLVWRHLHVNFITIRDMNQPGGTSSVARGRTHAMRRVRGRQDGGRWWARLLVGASGARPPLAEGIALYRYVQRKGKSEGRCGSGGSEGGLGSAD